MTIHTHTPTPRPTPDSIRDAPPQTGRGRVSVAKRPPADATETRPLLTGTRPGGSMADYDRLCEALERYEAEDGPQDLRRAAYAYLTAAADICGRPAGEPPLSWAKVRVQTYRQVMARAVGELASAIAVSNSLERVIGEQD